MTINQLKIIHFFSKAAAVATVVICFPFILWNRRKTRKRHEQILNKLFNMKNGGEILAEAIIEADRAAKEKHQQTLDKVCDLAVRTGIPVRKIRKELNI